MACSCNNTDLFNTGVPGCIPLVGVIKRIVLVPLTNASGVKNGIDLTAIPNNAAILALINQENSLERYYPVAKTMENVTNERGENITEDFPSGAVINLSQGVKTFHGEFIKQGATLAGELNKVKCISVGAYLVDSTGALVGDKSTAGYLYPMAIKDGTWSAKSIDTTDTTSAKVNLDFQWADSITDGDVGYLADSDFEAAVNWLSYIGLVGIFGGAASSIAAAFDSFIMLITNNYGSVSGQPVKGLAIGDFDINQISGTPAAGTLTAVTESTTIPGSYTFAFTAEQSGDVMQLSIKSSTLGFDDAGLKASTVTL
jgi:hypothetical protein